MIKIISGKYGGRFIETPEGRGTRPTTNRVREAVFNSLCAAYSPNLNLEGAVVLDMFAGSGALGFEALSRGAKFVTFCDKSPKAITIIKNNASSLNISPDSYEVLKRNSLIPNPYSLIPNLGTRDQGLGISNFDVILSDPPYAFLPKDVKEAIMPIAQEGTILCYEHSSSADISCFDEFETVYSKNFGEVGCSIFRV